MNRAHLSDMVKGWFVGNFNPTAFATEKCEVAVKNYKKGDRDLAHEITVVLDGTVKMLNKTWQS